MADDQPDRSKTVSWDDPSLAIRKARQMAGTDFFDAMRRGNLPEPPFAKLLGIDMFDCGEGRVQMTMQPQEVHYNPMGCVHGGILATLLDSVMSAAVTRRFPRARPTSHAKSRSRSFVPCSKPPARSWPKGR